jgi:hypothetical protein
MKGASRTDYSLKTLQEETTLGLRRLGSAVNKHLKPEGERERVKFIGYGMSATGGLFSQQQAYVPPGCTNRWEFLD